MKFLKFWFPVIVYSGIIFYASSWPNFKAPLDILWFDKVLHIVEYVPFGLLVTRALIKTKTDISKVQVWWLVLLIACLYGISDETHQMFVVGRTADFGDLAADMLGSLLGCWVFLNFIKQK